MRQGNLIAEEGGARLSDHVKIRKEFFGGIAFHTNTGDTLEVDLEAYKLLVWLRETGAVDVRILMKRQQVRATLPVLLTTNIIELCRKPASSDYLVFARTDDTPSESSRPAQHCLSAPETVHLAITYRCDEACPDCYAHGYHSLIDRELDTTEMRGIIDKLAGNGVFQLAIGGGEPFLRPDLSDIVSYAADSGLTVHITTGQYTLKPTSIPKRIKSLHVGIRSEEFIHNKANTAAKLRALEEGLSHAGVGLGANLIMTRLTIRHVDQLTELLMECGFRRLIFLRYKPIADRARWNRENPDGDDLRFFKDWLTHAKRQHPQLMLRNDCAATFLMRETDLVTAKQMGMKGCVAGDRILSIAPDGSVYPCSQLMGNAYRIGNLQSDSFSAIWHESDLLDQYRHFRQSLSFADGVCGKCKASPFCGGCRVFATDAVGSESFCPWSNH